MNKTNVLQIQATKTDKIAIEEEFAELDDIQDAVKEFYVHKKGDPRWPKYIDVTKKVCEDTLARLDEVLKIYPDAPASSICCTASCWSNIVKAITAILGNSFLMISVA